MLKVRLGRIPNYMNKWQLFSYFHKNQEVKTKQEMSAQTNKQFNSRKLKTKKQLQQIQKVCSL